MEADEKERLARLERSLREREQNLAFLATLVSSWARARVTGERLDETFGAPEIWELVAPEESMGPPCRRKCV